MLIYALHGKESIHEFGNWQRFLRINNFFFGNENKGVAKGGPGVPVTPPFCKPFLTKQPTTGGENAMTISCS